MFKIMICLWLLLPATLDTVQQYNVETCTCPEISSVQKTGQTSSSISFSWSPVSEATQYRVWYYRHLDSHTSSGANTTSTSYNFTGLSAGTYTFYFQVICGGEASGLIGVEDILQ